MNFAQCTVEANVKEAKESALHVRSGASVTTRALELGFGKDSYN